MYFVGFYYNTCLKLVVTPSEVVQFPWIGEAERSDNDEGGGLRGGVDMKTRTRASANQNAL